MTCNCHSYNWDIGKRPEVVLKTPEHLRDVRSNPEIVVDACIATTMQQLWCHEVITLGCCCGHGKLTPSIVIGESTDPALVRDLIAEVDDREFKIMQWQLMEV